MMAFSTAGSTEASTTGVRGSIEASSTGSSIMCPRHGCGHDGCCPECTPARHAA